MVKQLSYYVVQGGIGGRIFARVGDHRLYTPVGAIDPIDGTMFISFNDGTTKQRVSLLDHLKDPCREDDGPETAQRIINMHAQSPPSRTETAEPLSVLLGKLREREKRNPDKKGGPYDLDSAKK